MASLVAVLLQACGSTTPTSTTVPAPSRAPAAQTSPTAPATTVPPSPTAEAGTPAPSIPGPAGLLTACADDPTTFCGQLSVPVDRTKPDGPKISLALRLVPHTDTSQPALATVLSLPGGPGGGAGAKPGYQHDSGVLSEALVLRHDELLIGSRGTGASGAIDCPDLQDGWASDTEMQTAVAACAAQLGENADRYGSGDVALDIEDVRASLGLDQIDLYGESYGSVWARAYAERFPDRVHAIVLDSGLTVDDPADHWGSGYAQAWLQIAARSCAQSATCAKNHPHPVAELTALVRRIRAKPVHDPSSGSDVVIDSAALVGIFAAVGPFDDNVAAEGLLDAASANAHGDNGPVLKFSDWVGTGSGGSGDATGFSEGMHAAATCIDDPIARNSQASPCRPSDHTRGADRGPAQGCLRAVHGGGMDALGSARFLPRVAGARPGRARGHAGDHHPDPDPRPVGRAGWDRACARPAQVARRLPELDPGRRRRRGPRGARLVDLPARSHGPVRRHVARRWGHLRGEAVEGP